MGCDPTRAYFWPAENEMPTCLRPRNFKNQPEDIFFGTEGKKIEKFDVLLGEIFQIQTQTKDGWPGLNKKNLTRIHHYTLATK